MPLKHYWVHLKLWRKPVMVPTQQDSNFSTLHVSGDPYTFLTEIIERQQKLKQPSVTTNHPNMRNQNWTKTGRTFFGGGPLTVFGSDAMLRWLFQNLVYIKLGFIQVGSGGMMVSGIVSWQTLVPFSWSQSSDNLKLVSGTSQ